MRAASLLVAAGVAMVGAGCTTRSPAPASAAPVSAERSAVSRELTPIDLGRIPGGTTDVTDFSELTLAEIDERCPTTQWPWTLPDGTEVLAPPKFLTLGSTFTPLLDDAGRPLTITFWSTNASWGCIALSGLGRDRGWGWRRRRPDRGTSAVLGYTDHKRVMAARWT